MPIFEKKGPLDSTKEHLGVIFLTPPNMSSKKTYLGVNLGAKSCEISLGGVFPGEGRSGLGYLLKTSGHACIQR